MPLDLSHCNYLSAWCSCEVSKEIQQKSKRSSPPQGGSKTSKKISEKNIGLMADKQHRKGRRENEATPEVSGDLDVEPVPSTPPPLPPPPGAPSLEPEAALEVACQEQSTGNSRTKYGKLGRRGSHLMTRGLSEVESFPPESTPEPLPEKRLSMGVSPVGEVLAQVSTPERVLSVAPHEVAFFGVSTPGAHGLAVIENEFQDKTCAASVTSSALPGVRENLAAKDGIAVLCCKGKKPEQPNQDNFFFCQTSRFRLCCVADGHGESGHWVSHWVVRVVLQRLLMELETASQLPEDDAITRIFDLAHKTVQHAAKVEGFDVWLSGTTLTVVAIDRGTRQTVVAWTGDSRCVAGRVGAKGLAEVTVSTQDHKPQNPDEKRRIIASGGEVVRLCNDLPHRVFARGKEAPGLAMSRAVGDMMAHAVGVLHAPNFRRFNLEADQCLLCCSDGVWEFLKNVEALKLVLPLGRSRVSEAAALLIQESKERWLREDGGITDDITGIVIWGAVSA